MTVQPTGAWSVKKESVLRVSHNISHTSLYASKGNSPVPCLLFHQRPHDAPGQDGSQQHRPVHDVGADHTCSRHSVCTNMSVAAQPARGSVPAGSAGQNSGRSCRKLALVHANTLPTPWIDFWLLDCTKCCGVASSYGGPPAHSITCPSTHMLTL
jgi:hypothetical protein